MRLAKSLSSLAACFLLVLACLTSVATGQDLTDIRPVDRDFVVQSISELRDAKGNINPATFDPLERQSFLRHLRVQVETREGIESFRQFDTLDAILTLVELAALPDRAIRIESTLILANVVDNTTLCAVLNKLLGPPINDNSRYNLLQVVNVVASYARLENRRWIESVLGAISEAIEGKQELSKTAVLLDDIRGTLNRNKPADDATFAEKYPREYQACTALPNIATLESSPTPEPLNEAPPE